jgi:hypothetical protein
LEVETGLSGVKRRSRAEMCGFSSASYKLLGYKVVGRRRFRDLMFARKAIWMKLITIKG